MFKWKRDVEEFAGSLANQFAIDQPPSSLGEGRRKRVADDGSDGIRAEKVINRVVLEAERYQKSSKLGVIKKIFFARAFQRQMKLLGYNGQFIRSVTGKVLAAMSFAA